jgi:hypothetical protein
MRIFEPLVLASLALSGTAGFVGAAYLGPNFISADFNAFDLTATKPAPVNTSKGVEGRTVKLSIPKMPSPAPEGPGLRGAVRQHCSRGFYTAGYECKISPPNHYVPVGAIYPILCPPQTYTPAGAQSKGQCVKRENMNNANSTQGKTGVKNALTTARIAL